MVKVKAKRFRNWCITLNNYTKEETESILKLKENNRVIYLIVGEEVGDKEGTEHYQIYIELKNATTMEAVKKLFGTKRLHLEERKGTGEEASDYCKKDKILFEYGEMKKQGKRNDIINIRDEIVNNPNIGMKQLIQGDFIQNFQNLRIAEKLITLYEPRRKLNNDCSGYWIYGSTGIGKSRISRYLCNDGEYYEKMSDNKWWDGYDGEKNIIIEDYRHNPHMNYSELLRVVDRYGHRIEVKGGTRQLQANNVIISSSQSIKDCFKNLQNDSLKQIYRRVKVIDLEARLKLNKEIRNFKKVAQK